MRLKQTLRLRWLAVILCLAFALFLPCASASAGNLSAFDYLRAYHDAATDAEKDELIRLAYEEAGDEPLLLAVDLLYAGPFPADFSEGVIAEFIDRFSQFAPPDVSYLSRLSADERQNAQTIIKMAAIGYEELFTLKLMDKVVQSPNMVVRLWLEADLESWPKAVPHLMPDGDIGYDMLSVPEEKIDTAIPWGFDMRPDDALSVQTVFIGESRYDGSAYYTFQLGMLSLLPEEVRATDPFKAKYVIVVREKTETVGSYTNGKGAYRHDLVVEIYNVATGEAFGTTVHRGSEPPQIVTGDNAGYGTAPNKAEIFAIVIDYFIRMFVDKMV